MEKLPVGVLMFVTKIIQRLEPEGTGRFPCEGPRGQKSLLPSPYCAPASPLLPRCVGAPRPPGAADWDDGVSEGLGRGCMKFFFFFFFKSQLKTRTPDPSWVTICSTKVDASKNQNPGGDVWPLGSGAPWGSSPSFPPTWLVLIQVLIKDIISRHFLSSCGKTIKTTWQKKQTLSETRADVFKCRCSNLD